MMIRYDQTDLWIDIGNWKGFYEAFELEKGNFPWRIVRDICKAAFPRSLFRRRFFLAAKNSSCKWSQCVDFPSPRNPRRKADMLAFRARKIRRVNERRGKRDARLHGRGKIQSRLGKSDRVNEAWMDRQFRNSDKRMNFHCRVLH